MFNKKLVLLLIVFLFLFSVNLVFAACSNQTQGSDGKTVCLDNPLGKNITIPALLGQIINYAMGIIGSLALVMFIYGGAMWMLSGGNQEQVTKGKQTIIWAALGLAIIFTSYALVYFVITAFGGV